PYFFFFHDPAPTLPSTLSLHDALPIYRDRPAPENVQQAPLRHLLRWGNFPLKNLSLVTSDLSHTFLLSRGSVRCLPSRRAMAMTDRKSTRLNSSHSQISYAAFCLKKKT